MFINKFLIKERAKELPWVPEVFSRVRRGASFRRPKPETAHEKPLAPRIRKSGI